MFHSQTPSMIVLSTESGTSSEIVYAIHPISKDLVEIDPGQAWFWSPEWLAAEMAINQELLSGEYEEFDDIDELIDSL